MKLDDDISKNLKLDCLAWSWDFLVDRWWRLCLFFVLKMSKIHSKFTQFASEWNLSTNDINRAVELFAQDFSFPKVLFKLWIKRSNLLLFLLTARNGTFYKTGGNQIRMLKWILNIYSIQKRLFISSRSGKWKWVIILQPLKLWSNASLVWMHQSILFRKDNAFESNKFVFQFN